MTETAKTVRDTDEAFRVALADVMSEGDEIAPGKSASLSSGKRSREILHYSLNIENPRERLPKSLKNFRLPGAVARFVWMMAANDRLKDIAFYWDKAVTPYSDDGIIVPGSDYGKRMLNPRPGINQIHAIIERLREDSSSRRAAISIYEAEDAVRTSRDIPCAFGMMFHVRHGSLRPSIFMRSNNAVTLMPYNLFEFSLLSEVVAASLGIPLGPMYYFSGSMHIFDEAYERAMAVVQSTEIIVQESEMPTMPGDPLPIDQVKSLVKIEADARHGAAGFSDVNFQTWLDRVGQELNEYWAQLAYLLLLEMVRKRQLQSGLDQLKKLIASPWKEFIPLEYFTSDATVGQSELALLGVALPAKVEVSGAESVALRRIRSLDSLCERKLHETGLAGVGVISFTEYKSLKERLVGDTAGSALLAARELPSEISVDEFDRAFSEIRGSGGTADT
jgi:thymidylate synthase